MSVRTAVFALAAAAFLVVGLSTGSSIYYSIFAAMMLMLAAGLLSALISVMTVRVKADCSVRRIERGGKVAVNVRVKHLSPIPIRQLAIVLSTPDSARANHTVTLLNPSLRGRSYEYLLECPHRGVYRVGVARVTATDLFGLFRFSRNVASASFEVVVSPKTREMPPIDLKPGDTGPEYVSRMTEDNASPSDIRSWQDGDALKKVHWKLSMRKRELLVKTYEESARPDTLILSDLSPIGSLKTFSLSMEDAICETAASVALAQLRAGYPVRMPLHSDLPLEIAGQTAAESMRFVEALARVSFNSPYTYEQVLALETRRMQRTGGVVLVTAHLSARISDVALQMRRTGLQVFLEYISDAKRPESDELISRLMMAGIQVNRVNPYWNPPMEQVV